MLLDSDSLRIMVLTSESCEIEEYSLSARAEQLASASKALADGDGREKESRRDGRDAASG